MMLSGRAVVVYVPVNAEGVSGGLDENPPTKALLPFPPSCGSRLPLSQNLHPSCKCLSAWISCWPLWNLKTIPLNITDLTHCQSHNLRQENTSYFYSRWGHFEVNEPSIRGRGEGLNAHLAKPPRSMCYKTSHNDVVLSISSFTKLKYICDTLH